MHTKPRVWGTTEDGKIEFVSITSNTLEKGLQVMRGSFFIDEKACIGVELTKDPNAASELEELCVRAARDGVSLIALDKETGEPAGVAFNKLQVKSDGQDSYFEQYAANCRYPSAKALVQFMIDADAVVDLFEVCNSECLLELMFVATLPEFRNRGIAKKLFECSINLSQELLDGNNVKLSLEDDESLSIKPTPTVVSGIMTSGITQHISKSLRFVKAAEISYEKFVFEGKSFASRIGPDPASTTVEYLLLKKSNS